jgi:hypothetical protein
VVNQPIGIGFVKYNIATDLVVDVAAFHRRYDVAFAHFPGKPRRRLVKRMGYPAGAVPSSVDISSLYCGAGGKDIRVTRRLPKRGTRRRDNRDDPIFAEHKLQYGPSQLRGLSSAFVAAAANVLPSGIAPMSPRSSGVQNQTRQFVENRMMVRWPPETRVATSSKRRNSSISV